MQNDYFMQYMYIQDILRIAFITNTMPPWVPCPFFVQSTTKWWHHNCLVVFTPSL